MKLRQLFPRPGRAPVTSYLLPLVLVGLCAFVQYEGRNMIGPRAPLGLLYLPVMVSAMLGGWRQAVFASSLSLIAAPLLLEPELSFVVERREEQGAYAVFGLVCLFTCMMAGALERYDKKARPSY
jgi:K+-sensing histidine kinase KdpD